MSNKLTCPSCDRYTSALFRAYEDGRPCPYCGASLAPASAQFYRQLPDDHQAPERPTMNGEAKTPEAAIAELDALAAEYAERTAVPSVAEVYMRPITDGDRMLPMVGQPQQLWPLPVQSALIFTFCCRLCGTELDDARWYLSLQCERCDHLERRKRIDELIRDLIGDDELTITYTRAYDMPKFEELSYAHWPEPWWTIAFTVTEDFWEALMDMNSALGRPYSDVS